MRRASFATLLIFAATGCVTMGDFQKSQDQLKANASSRKVYGSPQEVAKDFATTCAKPEANKYEVAVTDQDPIIKQDESGTLGYFKALCFEADGKPHRLQVMGAHEGGGFGKAFFLLPKITLVDANGKTTPGNFLSVKQNPWSGNLQGTIDLAPLKKGHYVLVFEGDNRTGTNGIGTYVASTYGGAVFITTNIAMYSLPTGKGEIEVQ